MGTSISAHRLDVLRAALEQQHVDEQQPQPVSISAFNLGTTPKRYAPPSPMVVDAFQPMLLLCHMAAGLHILCAGWQPCLRRLPSR